MKKETRKMFKKNFLQNLINFASEWSNNGYFVAEMHTTAQDA